MPKRLRDGHVKRSTEAERGTKSLVGGKVSDFKADILALGGSVEDYELIADAPSDSEFENNESTKGLTKALETDLRKMVRELGIDKAVPDVESDSTSIRTDPDDGHDSVKPVDSAVRKSNLLTQPKGGEPMAEVPKPSKIKTKFPVQSEWHAATLPALTPSFETEPLPLDLIDRLHEHAKTLLEADNKLYGTQNKSATSAHQFYSTVMISGTLSDKVSALTLSVQESPLHNMKALESLLSLAGKRSRGQAVEVLGALKDLFGPGALLPPDRKLLFFANQPRLFAAFAASDFTWKANEPLRSH